MKTNLIIPVALAVVAAALVARRLTGVGSPTTVPNPRDEQLQMATSPQGDVAYIVGSQGSLRRLDLRTGKMESLTSGAKACRTPSVSPDGGTLAVSCSSDGERYALWLFDTRTGTHRKLPGGPADLFPAWSGDGKRLIFARAGHTNQDGTGLPASGFRLMLHDLDGGRTRSIGKDEYLSVQGLAAANGRFAVVGTLSGQSGTTIAEYAFGDNAGQRWIRPLKAGWARYGRDGGLLVATDPRGDFDYEVCRVGPTGVPRPLTRLATYIESFDPTANGRIVVLDSPSRDRSYRVVSVGADGSATPVSIAR